MQLPQTLLAIILRAVMRVQHIIHPFGNLNFNNNDIITFRN